MEVLLSVVIAAFNAEKTIGRTLNSTIPLLQQGAEIILVDDDSTDETLSRAKEFSATFSGLKIINIKHSGSAGSRNLGFLAASGKYVMFCDADDEMLNFDISDISKVESDFIICNYQYVKDRDLIEEKKQVLELKLHQDIHFEKNFATKCLNEMGFWRYIYRAEFLRSKKIRFVGTLAELEADYFVLDDYFFLLNVLSQYRTATCLETYVYRYYANPSASYLRYRQQSRFMARAATIQVLEILSNIHGMRWTWFSSNLRQQLFSSFHALLLKDAFIYFFDFNSAISLINKNSNDISFLYRIKDRLRMSSILLRHCAFSLRKLIKK